MLPLKTAKTRRCDCFSLADRALLGQQVAAGLNCGLFFEGFEDFQVGDVVECIEVRQVRS